MSCDACGKLFANEDSFAIYKGKDHTEFESDWSESMFNKFLLSKNRKGVLLV